MIGRAMASIDLSALQHNCRVVRRLVGPDRKIVAMIKADAYGHGLLPVAKALTSVDALGVATTDEAITLRESGVMTPISVMTGFTTMEELMLFFRHQLSPVIHHPLQLEFLEKAKVSNSIAVCLKVDTGMHRLGFSIDAFKNAFERLSRISTVQQPVQLMTHLADADNPDREFTEFQIQQFSQLTQSLLGIKSIGNSAGILAYPDAWADVVRPGIMLYGVSPFSDRFAEEFNLKPAMHLRSKVITIKPLKKGDRVGYGCMWECPEDMTIAVVGLGYGDGYPWHIKNGTSVLINDTICPTVGRVSMDMMAVDIRRQPNCKIDDEVTLWGHGLPIETIAASAETIPYELLCQLTQRVKVVYSSCE